MEDRSVESLLSSTAQAIQPGHAPLAEIEKQASRRKQRKVVASGTLAAAIVGLSALAATGWISVGDDTPVTTRGVNTTQLLLPTGDWTTDDGGLRARVTGVVAADTTGCVYVRMDEESYQAVWPQGFTAVQEADLVRVANPNGKTVGSSKMAFEASGAYLSGQEASSAGLQVCENSDVQFAGVMVVQTQVRPYEGISHMPNR